MENPTLLVHPMQDPFQERGIPSFKEKKDGMGDEICQL